MSNATDVIGVIQSNKEINCSPFIVQFYNSSKNKKGTDVEIYLNNKKLGITMFLPYGENEPLFSNFDDYQEILKGKNYEKDMIQEIEDSTPKFSLLIPNPKEIGKFFDDLKPGYNEMKYEALFDKKEESICGFYLWNDENPVIISDIDGTVTKSNVRGMIFNKIGIDWTHKGISPLFDLIHENGYNFIFLTARSISQCNETRNYIHNISQNDKKMPPGPVITTPNNKLYALIREVVIQKPHLFKISILSQIGSAFSHKKPYFAGFGNNEHDHQAYSTLGIKNDNIYIVDKHSNLSSNKYKDGSYEKLTHEYKNYFPKFTLIENNKE